MSSHADTIRRSIEYNSAELRKSGNEALDALLAEIQQLREDARLALGGLPDPMHPALRKWADVLVSAQILIARSAGEDDPGDVQAARSALAAVGE